VVGIWKSRIWTSVVFWVGGWGERSRATIPPVYLHWSTNQSGWWHHWFSHGMRHDVAHGCVCLLVFLSSSPWSCCW
jgi:hypothetical protein